ncbi:MAG: glycoside hydrolase family 2 TIM barrel-domain containing protein [Verrucomicrobiota bacterium]
MSKNLEDMPEVTFHWPGTKVIDEDWLYLERDTVELPLDPDFSYKEITLPHTWNAEDVLEVADYRRGSSWYRKNLFIGEGDLDERIYLRFGAAGQDAKVFLNGVEIGDHVGGYSAFTCELTDGLVPGKNRIDVWVSNAQDRTTIPKSGDFNFYGGLYRSVQLLTAPEVSIRRDWLGGPGYRVWSENVSDTLSDLRLTAHVDNGSDARRSIRLEATLSNPEDGSIVSTGEISLDLGTGEATAAEVPMSDVASPRLWSPEDPFLYDVSLKLFVDGKFVEECDFTHGFRWFQFNPDKGFFLNGKPYPLKGVNRHQDFEGIGSALSPRQHYEDLKLIKDVGANWLRLAHYQQDDYVLQLCDRMGLLVWEEIPYVNGGRPDLIWENAHSMLLEMIEQHFNHPSVIIWGLSNEVWIDDRGDGYANIYDLIESLQDLVHAEDTVRKAGFVTNKDKAARYKIADLIDVIGYNLYFGWYGSTVHESFTEGVTRLRDISPQTPIIITEYGAGSDLSIHTESPGKQDFSTQYQNEFLESHLKQMAEIEWLNGANWWSMFDFGSAKRGDSMPHINQKGLATFTRDKKDSFFLMKSYYSDDPVVYIESPFWTNRHGDSTKDYRVFTNMDEVEFFHNGESLGTLDDAFVWEVDLVEGENTLEAIGTNADRQTLKHTFTVSYQEAPDNRGPEGYFIEVTGAEADNPAFHLVDDNPSTRWAAKNPQEIAIDMNETRLLDGIEIAFHLADKRTYDFNVFGSVDGTKWTPLLVDGRSSSKNGMQFFEFPEQGEVRYLRIDALGNSTSNWNSYLEIHPVLADSREFTVQATDAEVENPASHLSDGNPETYWAGEGEQTIDLDLGRPFEVNGMRMLFVNGEKRTYDFEIQLSNTGAEWITVFDGRSERDADSQDFTFQSRPQVQFMRIVTKGNDIDDRNGFYEIKPILAE